MKSSKQGAFKALLQSNNVTDCMTKFNANNRQTDREYFIDSQREYYKHKTGIRYLQKDMR